LFIDTIPGEPTLIGLFQQPLIFSSNPSLDIFCGD
jgi:hypothetical protein